MEEGEGKLDPSLPPDYVSLAQLQEQWIQRQQELKLNRKEKEDQKGRDARTQNLNDGNQNQGGLENHLHEEMVGLSVGDVLRGKGEKDGRKMSVIEDKGKGKEKVIGEEKKKNKKKRNFNKGNSMAGGEKEKLRSEIKELDGGDGSEGVWIVPGNEVKVGIKGVLSGESSGRNGGFKGTEEIGGVSMVEVLPVKRVDYGSGFRRDGYNQGSGCKSRKEYGKKMEDENGYGKWRERRNGEYREGYTLKENRTDVLEGNVTELKAEDEVLEVCNEIGGLNGRNQNDDRVELVKKVDDEVLVVESAKSGENGRVGNGHRRYGNQRENIGRKHGGFTYNDRNNARSRMAMNDGVGRRFTRFGSYGDRRKMIPRESGMVWVKKEENKGADGAEVGSSGIQIDQA